MKKNFCRIFCLCLVMNSGATFAALPFVTDDAAIADVNQLLIEAFSEIWHLPKKGDNQAARINGNYLGLGFGAAKNLEVTVGGIVGYDFNQHSTTFMNPIIQLKSMVYQSKNKAIPSFAISGGYVNNSGSGQYRDPATSAYLIVIATSKFFDEDLVIHINSGPKASYDLTTRKNLYRLQLGIAFDAALTRKDLRLIAESYNGTPNSPRDSSEFFHSYQAGLRFIKSNNLAFHVLYGSQPTFAVYDQNNNLTYRRTDWIQFGIRKAIDDIF